MLVWKKLLDQTRLKDINGASAPIGTGVGRTEFERDYDRILFATPTRRLADKTQVFPMEENDSIRTRLTHSHEVSNLARSIGVQLAFNHALEVFGDEHEKLDVKRNVPSLLAAVGLAHDLGNPPFGHQGEVAIQQYFREKNRELKNIEDDFLGFDGNAQTFRLLTKLQYLNDEFGLNLTVGTLAALVKYPTVYGSGNKAGFKKHGVFTSESQVISDVWKLTGLAEGIRHPLAYVMEACDDIAYSIIDAEDTVKKGCASFYDLMDFLESFGGGNSVIAGVVKKAREDNKKIVASQISSREINDLSMQLFRVRSISLMVQSATDTFVGNVKRMLDGSLPSGFGLIESSQCAELCRVVKDFDYRYGFQHKEVLRLELQGNSYIKTMMGIVESAIDAGDDKEYPFERFVFLGVSENYRRVFERSNKSPYFKRQLLCDAISGMTESYLVNRCDEYKVLISDAP